MAQPLHTSAPGIHAPTISACQVSKAIENDDYRQRVRDLVVLALHPDNHPPYPARPRVRVGGLR